MMAAIWKHAQRVIVWLGPGSENSKLALSTLEGLGAKSTTNKHTVPEPDLLEPDSWELPDNLDNTSRSIFQLLDYNWFNRVWTVQEVRLANEHSIIKCGKDQILWSHFCKGIQAFWDQMLPIYPRASRNLALTIRQPVRRHELCQHQRHISDGHETQLQRSQGYDICHAESFT